MKSGTSDFSGILLAGGKSSRMGEDKAFMKYGSHFLYEYSLSILKFFSEDIMVSSSDKRFSKTEIRLIEDEVPGLGPIGGLYTCLKKSKFNHAIILPCDLPLVNKEIIETLILNSKNFDITVPLNNQHQPEPLVGIYSVSVIPLLEKMIKLKQYKMHTVLSSAKTNFVALPNITSETFKNVNNPMEFDSLPPGQV